MSDSYKRHLRDLDKKSLGINFFLFTLAKACVFIGPLFLSNLVSLTTYGLFEYSIVAGGYISIFLSGTLTSYPYKIIKQKKVELFPAYLLQFLFVTCLSVVFLLLTTFNLLRGINARWIICMTLINLTSTFLSVIYKTHTKTIKSVVFESILYIGVIMFCALTFVWKFDINNGIFYFLVMLLCGICIYFFINFWTYLKIDRSTFRNYLHLLRFNVPLLVTGFLIVLLTNSGRLIVDKVFSKDEVGIYSLYFRLSSGVFILYQFVNNLYLKKLYTTPKDNLDRFLFVLFSGLAVCNIVLMIILPPILKDYILLLKDYERYRIMYWMISMQNVLWIAVSINENLIYRENISRKLNPTFITLMAGAFGLLLIIDHFCVLSIEQVVFYHIGVIFLGLELQYAKLYKAQVPFKKTRMVNYLIMASVVIAFVISLRQP